MTQRMLIIWLTLGLSVFAVADHVVRPLPDYAALEIWRPLASGGCAPCGVVCDNQT